MRFWAIFLKSIIGVCMKLHQNTLLMILFAAVEVAESAEAWKGVILHIDWVNMCENSLFLILTGEERVRLHRVRKLNCSL